MTQIGKFQPLDRLDGKKEKVERVQDRRMRYLQRKISDCRR